MGLYIGIKLSLNYHTKGKIMPLTNLKPPKCSSYNENI